MSLNHECFINRNWYSTIRRQNSSLISKLFYVGPTGQELVDIYKHLLRERRNGRDRNRERGEREREREKEIEREREAVNYHRGQ